VLEDRRFPQPGLPGHKQRPAPARNRVPVGARTAATT
jgi:hypothetical protein